MFCDSFVCLAPQVEDGTVDPQNELLLGSSKLVTSRGWNEGEISRTLLCWKCRKWCAFFTPLIQKTWLLLVWLYHIISYYVIQVVPGRAGGGSFRRKKNYIAKKEFAYRMCARWPTIAMFKLLLGLNEVFAVAWLWCHVLWGDMFVIWLAFEWCG